MLTSSNVKQATGLDIAISSPMATALTLWSQMYENAASWLNADVKSLNLAATVAAEIARAVTIEMEVTVSGSARADFLASQLDNVIDRLRVSAEYATAKGGLMMKPYISGNMLAVDFVQADQFYPIAFDANGKMTSCIFSDTKIVGNYYYTRLEYHAWTPNGYRITNTAFRSTTKDMLGNQVPLSFVPAWAELQPEANILNVERPLFAYFKMPFANNVDPTSPLGVSCYARATDLIRQADEIWSNLLWEFDSGKRAIYADTLAFGKDDEGKPILPIKKLYRTLDSTGDIGTNKKLFEDWSPAFREASILSGLDAVLKRIEFNCGLAQGTISDPATVALTATEIKMSRQRTYATIVDTQKSLEDAIEGLLYAMDVWTTIGNLAPRGDYSVVYYFDDSIVADHDTAFSQDMQVLDRVMSKVEFRMRNYGEDEVTARKMVAMVTAEQQPVDFFQDGG